MDRQELEKILCGKVPDLSGKEIWIWGAGNTAQLYHEGFQRLRQEGFDFKGYIDKKVSQERSVFNGKPVIAPEGLTKQKDVCVLICTIREAVIKDIKSQCEALQLECYLLDEVILKLHGRKVLDCYDLLSDQRSKEIYAELAKWRVTGCESKAALKESGPYFCLERFAMEDPKEVFVDCGAYIGDSIEEYLKKKKGTFQKIIAFEPDMQNYSRLKEQVEKECGKWGLQESQFECYPYGIGERGSTGVFERYEGNDGYGSKVIEASSEEGGNLRIVALDEFLNEPYSFLKADIEGYEYQMLLGAQNGIRKHKPLLAVCIYHNAVDFYSIPLLIKEILPEYQIAVRQHLDDLSETVVYAWT